MRRDDENAAGDGFKPTCPLSMWKYSDCAQYERIRIDSRLELTHNYGALRKRSSHSLQFCRGPRSAIASDNRQCDDGKRGVPPSCRPLFSKAMAAAGRAEIRVTLGRDSGVTGYGHDKSDRYDHGD